MSCASVVPNLHMDRAAAGITLAVILFVTVVIGVLIVKGHRSSAPREEIVSTQADQEIREIHIQEDAKGGGYRWRLDAERAETFPGTGKTLLRKVTIGVEEPGRKWKVTSDEGDLIQDTRDVELRGNVVLVSSEGLRVETTVLKWMNADGKIWTEQPVTIYRSGGVVKGTGLDAMPSQETAVVRGRVQATFGATKAGAPASPKSKL
jgi:LPS export ABC transporter protein LptC